MSGESGLVLNALVTTLCGTRVFSREPVHSCTAFMLTLRVTGNSKYPISCDKFFKKIQLEIGFVEEMRTT